jgi:hypothetical protein
MIILPMKLIAAWIQVIVVLLIVAYGTWQLFEGNFVQSFATLPFLFAYYVFIVVRLRKKQTSTPEDLEDN